MVEDVGAVHVEGGVGPGEHGEGCGSCDGGAVEGLVSGGGVLGCEEVGVTGDSFEEEGGGVFEARKGPGDV